MIIQHNISALNSYNKLAGNNKALAKNLEKLSSGYKINRAADDAAGLGISEKMRAQITGMNRAQQNSKDGISLVQTAEGALTEVHSMLNRMVDLTTQASNGVYTNDEKTKIKDELAQLESEIDRIADATNFNGIKLLDGKLGASGTSGGSINTDLTTTKVAAVAHEFTNGTALSVTNLNGPGAKATYTFNFSDGTTATFDVELKANATTAANSDIYIDGEKVHTGTAAAPTAANMSQYLAEAFEKKYGDQFTIDGTTTAGKFVITSKETGADALTVDGIVVSGTKDDGTKFNEAYAAAASGTTSGTNTIVGANEKTKIAIADITEYTGGDDVADKTFTINGQKFLLAKNDVDLSQVDSDITVLTYATTATTAADIKAMAQQLTHKLGIDVSDDGTTGFLFDAPVGDGAATGGAAGGNGLRLQIGETNDSFNQLDVTIDDCHAAALGVAGLSIDTPDAAAASMMKAKAAIEQVSKTRSLLGATQNRLDHTLANLEETTTNLTEAESRIRDTDMANEMMKYTKNNILIQSSQAMLAQANQVPQGVLQLLQ